MFLSAAIRSHVERRENRSLAPLLPMMGGLRTRIELRKWLFVTAGLALFLTLLAMLLLDDRRAARPASVPASPHRACRRRAADRGSGAVGARAALAAGRYESPAGRNALDLYAPCCSPGQHTRRRAPGSTRPRRAWWQWRQVKRRPVTRTKRADWSDVCWRSILARLGASAAGATGHAAGSGDRTSRLARRDSGRAVVASTAAPPVTRVAPPATPPVPAAQPAAIIAAPVAQAAYRARHAGPGNARSADATRCRTRGPRDRVPRIEPHVRPPITSAIRRRATPSRCRLPSPARQRNPRCRSTRWARCRTGT